MLVEEWVKCGALLTNAQEYDDLVQEFGQCLFHDLSAEGLALANLWVLGQ
jgi:hypothetical protein